MYDSQSYFVDNPLNRHTVSSWMPLQRNSEGSTDLDIQPESPGTGREVDRLPAPAGNFNITLRMYCPKDQAPSIIDGTWVPPVVTAVLQ